MKGHRTSLAFALVTIAAVLASIAHAEHSQNDSGGAKPVDEVLVVEDPSIARGLEWLWSQTDASFGFKDLTAKAVTTLQLANATSWYGSHNLHSLLAVKQMQIELLVLLTRHGEATAAPSELAEYSLALSALCLDPRQLHGIDLIGVINHHPLLLDWELAVASLASCSAGTHIRKRQLRRLLEATQSNENLSIDTLSMVMIALNCIVQDHRNRHLQHYLSPPTHTLSRHQNPDGGFGNLKSTAMAVQALQATDPAHHHWNYTAAMHYITSYQQKDGSFSKDIEATMLSLLALGPRSLANIKDLECHRQAFNDEYNSLHMAELTLNLTSYEDADNHLHPNTTNSAIQQSTLSPPSTTENTPSPPQVLSLQGKVFVSYTVWLDTNSSLTKTINVTTEIGSNFYRIMQIAAQSDTFFAYQATEWPNGHYIHTLAGKKEEPMTYRYWLLYKLSAPPNINQPPTNQFVAPLGVDDLIVKNNEYYLFWYKKL